MKSEALDGLSHPAPVSYMLGDMDNNKTALERAFDLARSGTCLHVSDIIRHLNNEGYLIGQIEGPSLNKQLKELIEKAKKPNA